MVLFPMLSNVRILCFALLYHCKLNISSGFGPAEKDVTVYHDMVKDFQFVTVRVCTYENSLLQHFYSPRIPLTHHNKYPSVSLCLFWLLSIRKHIYPPTLSFTSSCTPSVHQQQFKITCCELFIYKDMTHNNQKQFNQIAYKSLYIAKV